MKISELITKLESLKNEHGDLNILLQEDGFGGYSMNTLSNRIVVGSIWLNSIENFDKVTVKELFPEWDGNPDTEQDLETTCVVIKTSINLYTT